MLTEFRTPRIIKETSSGLFCCDIRDEMLQNREIECVGQINAESVYSLCLQLRYLQADIKCFVILRQQRRCMKVFVESLQVK